MLGPASTAETGRANCNLIRNAPPSSQYWRLKQNRMSKRADSRAHLDLQINLLAEKEMTMVLQMLRLIGEQVGVRDKRLDRELAQLSRETPVEMLANEIEESLPKES